MAHINVTNVAVHNNPSPIGTGLHFEVTFECLKGIPDELEWKLIYISPIKDEKGDQILSCFQMGPIEAGVMRFDITSEPPNYGLIPPSELFNATALVISTSYHNQEFFRIGYYLIHEYDTEELKNNPPEQIIYNSLRRLIFAQKPIITKPMIDWGEMPAMVPSVIPTPVIQGIFDPFTQSNGVFNLIDKVAENQNQNNGNWNYGMMAQQKQSEVNPRWNSTS